MGCPSCATPNPAYARFCKACGCGLGARCPACDTPVARDHSFCTQCGMQQERTQSIPPTTAVVSEVVVSAGPSSVAPPKPTPTTELHKGDRRVVTVLFTDVSGFTAMSERLDPEEVTGIVNRFFQVLTEPIYRYGGVVDKYLGDAIMALFGAPVAHEDDALRGVLAGWAMQQAASGFAEDLEGKTGIKLRVRVGLHTGLVVAGSVGGSQRADYTVTGETVTIASKMEAAAPPGGVLVSAETWRQVQGHFRGEPAATPPSASKDQPLAAWQILGPEHDEGPSLGGQDADVIGRLEEQKALATSWQSVLDGRPAGLILAGDVGSGKSLLLRQETRRFRQEGALVLWGRGVSFDRDRAHAVAASVLQPLLENRGPTPEEAFAALEGLVARWLPYNVPRSTSSLAHLLGLPVTHPEVASLSPQQRRSASFVVLDDLVIAMAREGPTVLVIDDVQWADAPSLAWLEGLLQRLEREAGTVRLLLLLATREPETLPGIFERHPTFRSIRLAPLAPEESSAFVTTLLQAVPESLSPAVRHLVDEVLGKAEGNPFYLKELIRAVQEAGVLVREGATWSVASSEGGFRLPSSVQGALAARLDQLDASPRQVLQVASVLGRTVEDPLLSVVLDRNADRDLADLVRLGFLYPMPEARHAFTQAVAQEVAYENLLLSARRDWHGKAARAIEERTVPGTPDRARVLAHHLGRAEQDGPATRYAFEAAEEARFAFGNEEAIRLYRQALEHFDRLTLDIDPGLTKAHILAGLATVLTVTGEVVLAQEGFLEALAHAPDDPDRGSWEAGLIRAIIRQGDTRGAIARCQRRIGEVTDPEEEATLRATLAEQLMTSGDLDQAEAQCQLALGLIRADLQPLVMADVMNILGNVASRRGRPEAIGYYQRMLTLVDEARDVPRRVVGLTNLAMAQELAGDWGAAADAYDRAHAICARIGDRSRSAHILNNLGGLRLKLGLLDEATEAIQGADTLYESLGNPLGRAACANFIGRIHLAREAPIEAIPCFEASVRLLEQAGAGTYAAEVLRGLGQALLLAERLETSREVLRKAASLAADAGQQAESAMIRLLEGRLLAAEGHLEAGLAQGKEALEDVRRHGHSLDKGQAMVHLAYLARQAGETREADTLLLGARDLFEGIRATQEIRRVEALLKQA